MCSYSRIADSPRSIAFSYSLLEALSLLTKKQALQAIEVFKDSFKMSDQNIAEMFIKNPMTFSTGFDKFISQYNYFEDNFGVSRHMYRKMLLDGDEQIILRDDLTQTYKSLNEKIKSNFFIITLQTTVYPKSSFKLVGQALPDNIMQTTKKR